MGKASGEYDSSNSYNILGWFGWSGCLSLAGNDDVTHDGCGIRGPTGPWSCHDNGNDFRITCTLWAESTGLADSLHKGAAKEELYVFVLSLTNMLNKHSNCWWFGNFMTLVFRHRNTLEQTTIRWHQNNMYENYIVVRKLASKVFW